MLFQLLYDFSLRYGPETCNALITKWPIIAEQLLDIHITLQRPDEMFDFEGIGSFWCFMKEFAATTAQLKKTFQFLVIMNNVSSLFRSIY